MSKIIVVSLDGTMDSLQTTPTHIAEMQTLFDPTSKAFVADTNNQEGWQVKYYFDTKTAVHGTTPSMVTYYDEGLGAPHVDKEGHFIKWSKQPAQFAEKLVDTFHEFEDAAFAYGVNDKVAKAYRFLAQNYVPSDKVFCFGFSRGSYEAILLATMIRTIGLINIDSPEYKKQYNGNLNKAIADGFSHYKKHVHPDKNHAAVELKKKYCHDGKELIHMMGLFDPVKGLVDVKVPDDHHIGNVAKHFRQALAIDEHRSEYEPIKVRASLNTCTRTCWFAGSHGDIGGGYKKRHPLSNIPMRWMLDEAMQCGLPVAQEELALNYPVNSLDAQHNSLADNIPFTKGLAQWKDISTHYERPICTKTPFETVHPSALFRFGHEVDTQNLERQWVKKDYTPKNLETAVKMMNNPKSARSNEERGMLYFNRSRGYNVPGTLPITDKDIKDTISKQEKVKFLINGRKSNS